MAARGPTSRCPSRRRFVGRAVAALAVDPERARWNPRSGDSKALAREYGFTDVDGSKPDIGRFMADRERGRDAQLDDYR